MNSFETYLHQHSAPATVTRYLRELQAFSEEIIHPEAASYPQIIHWIGTLRSRGLGPSAIACRLHGIKAWFSYLQATGQRQDHPAAHIRLRDQRRSQPQLQQLFSEAELLSLLDRTERYQALRLRNQVIIGLMIFQGLRPAEIARIRQEHLQLSQGQIEILPSRQTNRRVLPLQPQQILQLHQLSEEAETTLISLQPESMGSLLASRQHRFPGRPLHPRSVRQSVIANWLAAGLDLSRVQYLAGHRYPSSTERYREAGIEALKAAVLTHHPLE